MALLLRKITGNKWVNQDHPWLRDGEVCAETVVDLKPVTGNTLSLWEVQDDLSNLDRVIAALAATQNLSSEIATVLIDDREFARHGIETHRTVGLTPDAECNERWHRDVIQLSGTTLNSIAATFKEAGDFKHVFLRHTVLDLVVNGAASKKLALTSAHWNRETKTKVEVALKNI